MGLLPTVAAAVEGFGLFTGWVPHRPDLRRRRGDTSALVFMLVAILAPNAFVNDAIGTSVFAILGGASIWTLLMVFPPATAADRRATPAIGSSRFRRGPLSVGLITIAVMIAGSPSSMATKPIFAIVVAVVVGACFATVAAAFQILLSAPITAPPPGIWPHSAPVGPLPGSWPRPGAGTPAAAQRGRAVWSAAPSQAAPDNSLALVVERYTSLLYSTERANRPIAEAAIGSLYRDAGLDPPPCVWVRSPREAMLAQGVLRALAGFLGGPAKNQARAWQAVRRARPHDVGSEDWEGLIDTLQPSLVDVAQPARIFAGDYTTLAWDPPDYTGIILGGTNPGAARLIQGSLAIRTVVNRQQAAITYALGDEAVFAGVHFDHPTGLPQSINALIVAEQVHAQRKGWVPLTRTTAMVTLLETCGGWWPTPLAVVLTERPIVAKRDERGLLHSADGPALAYADGWRVFANHGTPVPREAFEHPDTIDVSMIRSERDDDRRRWLIASFGSSRYLEAIADSLELIKTEPNVGLRRQAINRFGVARFVQEAGTVIDSDLDGLGQVRRLWRAPRDRDEPIVLVEVVNSTPEADGSRHHYWLRVPPDRTGCQNAVAWTFGINSDDYHPQFES